MSRANPFEDMEDFVPEARPKPVEPAAIEQIARDSGFISRQATAPTPAEPVRLARRHYTTGRNQQMNVKATPETIARFYRLADERREVLGELLEAALDALEQQSRPAPPTSTK
jgi:hypothetical protein